MSRPRAHPPVVLARYKAPDPGEGCILPRSRGDDRRPAAVYFLLAIPVVSTDANPADSAADDALVLLLKILAGAGFVCSFFFAVALADAAFGSRADAERTRPRDDADLPR